MLIHYHFTDTDLYKYHILQCFSPFGVKPVLGDDKGKNRKEK